MRPGTSFILTLGFLGVAASTLALHWASSLPCARPVRYSIGSIDARFGISRQELASAVRSAAALWEAPAGRPLFEEIEEGGLTVNAVFDYRQESQKKMTELGQKVEAGKESYDALQARYDALQARYETSLKSLQDASRVYEERRSAYVSALEDAKSRGLTADDVARLEAMRSDVNAQVDVVNAQRDAVKKQIDELNQVYASLSTLGSETNRAIDAFNTVGDALHDEYEAAVYSRQSGVERIDIYAFDDADDLRRLLTHELGHALGLLHLEATGAIMYRLNQHTNAVLDPADVQALKELCRL